MKCQKAQGLLSAYHDGELPANQRIALEVHLEGCPRCAAELAELRRLSELVSNSEDPQPPSELRDRVLEQRGRRGEDVRSSKRRTYAAIAVLSAVATTAAIVIGIAAPWRHRGHVEHVDLAQYWESFQADPLPVQSELLARHAGRVVSADEAMREVGYRPLVATRVPDEVRVETNYLLNMPCCKCIETICRRPDGTAVAVFEHQAEEPGWFPNRPHVTMQCAATTCRVTELAGSLAASWPAGDRVVTVVGLRNVDELTRWVRAMLGARSARHSPGGSGMLAIICPIDAWGKGVQSSNNWGLHRLHPRLSHCVPPALKSAVFPVLPAGRYLGRIVTNPSGSKWRGRVARFDAAKQPDLIRHPGVLG